MQVQYTVLGISRGGGLIAWCGVNRSQACRHFLDLQKGEIWCDGSLIGETGSLTVAERSSVEASFSRGESRRENREKTKKKSRRKR